MRSRGGGSSSSGGSSSYAPLYIPYPVPGSRVPLVSLVFRGISFLYNLGRVVNNLSTAAAVVLQAHRPAEAPRPEAALRHGTVEAATTPAARGNPTGPAKRLHPVSHPSSSALGWEH
jgi:hypothetical protein